MELICDLDFGEYPFMKSACTFMVEIENDIPAKIYLASEMKLFVPKTSHYEVEFTNSTGKAVRTKNIFSQIKWNIIRKIN